MTVCTMTAYHTRKTRRLFRNACEGKVQNIRRHVARHRKCDRAQAWEWYAKAAIYATVNRQSEVMIYLITVLKTFGDTEALYDVCCDCLDQACSWGYTDMVDAILQRLDASLIPTDNLKFAFVNCCIGGNMLLVRGLMNHIVPRLCSDEAIELHSIAIGAAALFGHRDIVTFLMKLSPQHRALLSAARGGHLLICDDLLRDIENHIENHVENQYGYNASLLEQALIAAASEGHTDVCLFLCEKGATVTLAALASARLLEQHDTLNVLLQFG